MSSLLVPPLASDPRSQAVEALSQRLEALDRSALLVYLIDLVPADVLPYLAEQFNVTGPLWRYLPDEQARRRAIKESVAWHRAKGTPWSIETALSWAGYVATVEDTTGTPNRWTEYQLELAAPIESDALQVVLELARFAAPARAHLVRLYHGHDLRPLQLDHSRLDDALLDDDSGVDIAGVKLSFGTRHAAALADETTPVASGMTRTYSTRVWDDNSWRLDAWALDSEILIDAAGGMVAQLSTFTELEADEPSAVARLDEYAFVSTVADESTINTRTDTATTTARSDTRGWTGPWSGSWREPIPTRTTFEEA